MKKIILGLCFTVGFSAASFAKTEVRTNSQVSEFKDSKEFNVELCGVAITYYDKNGFAYDVDYKFSDQPTLASCQSWQSNVINSLIARGYIVTSESSAPIDSTQP